MASFDPSALQDIQPPDIAGGVARGFQLKDLADSTQLNTLKLNQEKQTLADTQKTKSILSSSKLNTSEGLAEAQEKLTRAGLPDKAMELRKYGQQVESGELDNQLKNLDYHLGVQTYLDQKVGSIVASISSMADEKKADGKSPKYDRPTIDAMTNGALAKAVADIQNDQTTDDRTKKLLMEQVHKFMSTGQPVTFDSVAQAYSRTTDGVKQIKAKLDQLNVKSEIENRGVQRQQEQEKIGIERDKLNIAKQNAGSFGGRISSLMATAAENGVSLPAGLRSKQQQQALWQGLIDKNPGKTDQEIIAGVKSGQISMGVSKTEASVLGRREAAILPVEKSITRPGGFLDQAEKAVNSVDFPKLKAAGEFSKWSKEQQSDPALSRYKAAVAELRAEYSIVLSKGGQVTDAARHEAEKVIPDLITKEQFKAIKQVVLQGIESSKGGIEESISGVTGNSAPAPTTPTNVVNWNDLK